jgi:hypothetical protein
MITNMDAWVGRNIPPPASTYPRLDDSTLVSFDQWAFPSIPGVNKPHEANQATRLDFGPNWHQGFLTVQPPKVGAAFPVLVPQVNADGNERDGARLPEIVVPLATYTGWNLRDPAIGAPDQRVAFEGSYIPFAKTAEERKRSADPRESIAERYPTREVFLARYQAALDVLISEHWILKEDRDAMLERGKLEWAEATK